MTLRATRMRKNDGETKRTAYFSSDCPVHGLHKSMIDKLLPSPVFIGCFVCDHPFARK